MELLVEDQVCNPNVVSWSWLVGDQHELVENLLDGNPGF